jgi:predicted secreted hydrolase
VHPNSKLGASKMRTIIMLVVCGALLLPLGTALVVAEDFHIPRPGRVWQFPRDHGAHPDFKTEWWYYSGHLRSQDGETFGYQLTFFRAALGQPDPQARSAWRGNTVYFAHLALSDAARRTFRFWDKAGRGALGLSGADAGRLKVWIDDWQAEQEGDPQHLQARAAGVGLDLHLTPLKPPVLHGEQGFSRKAAGSQAASYYYSLPRLETRGQLTLGDRELAVTGLSWMDHEFFTSAMAPDLVGWDWFALQLSDGWDLMLYRLRQRDGAVDPASAGTLIDPQGQARPLTHQDFQVQPGGSWKSPHTGAVYPAGWEVDLPGTGYQLTLTPTLPDQEIRAGAPQVTYWEGEVKVQGRKNGTPITGQGFVELTGYAGAMGSRF